MKTGFLDSFVLVCPPEDSNEDELDKYLRDLLMWRDLVDSELFPTFISARAAQAVADVGGFPPWTAVSRILTRLRSTHIQTKDVFEVFQRLLDRIPKVEDQLSITDILVEEVDCDPDFHKQRPAPLIESFERLLAMICFVRNESNDLEDDHYLVLTRSFRNCPDAVRFCAGQVTFESLSGSLTAHSTVQGRFPVFSCAARARASMEPEEIWRTACAIRDYTNALLLYLERADNETPRLRWSYGSEFVKTVEHLHLKSAAQARAILRACSETILSVHLSATHALRTGRGPNSPQRKRGNDLAFRRDIDHEFHLHYWQCSAGIEFAAIVVHNDFDIPE